MREIVRIVYLLFCLLLTVGSYMTAREHGMTRLQAVGMTAFIALNTMTAALLPD